MSGVPEVYGGGCECWVTPEHMHYVYYGITEHHRDPDTRRFTCATTEARSA